MNNKLENRAKAANKETGLISFSLLLFSSLILALTCSLLESSMSLQREKLLLKRTKNIAQQLNSISIGLWKLESLDLNGDSLDLQRFRIAESPTSRLLRLSSTKSSDSNSSTIVAHGRPERPLPNWGQILRIQRSLNCKSSRCSYGKSLLRDSAIHHGSLEFSALSVAARDRAVVRLGVLGDLKFKSLFLNEDSHLEIIGTGKIEISKLEIPESFNGKLLIHSTLDSIHIDNFSTKSTASTIDSPKRSIIDFSNCSNGSSDSQFRFESAESLYLGGLKTRVPELGCLTTRDSEIWSKLRLISINHEAALQN